MPAKDIFHNTVKNALQKDGWTITHDPLSIRFGKVELYVDLGAEKLIAAQKNGEQIAVEIVRKRLNAFRPTKQKDLSPFTEEIIHTVNKQYATGNPRMLLLVLRSILDVAAHAKVKEIDQQTIEKGVEFAREKLKDAQSERIKQILTPKMRDILEIIIGEKEGGPVIGTALADELGMDQGNLSRYLNQMAALNFLNKHRDGRIVSYEIKPELRLIFAEELGLTQDKQAEKNEEE